MQKREPMAIMKPLLMLPSRLLAEKAGISWGTSAHTCVNVPVYAIGTGAERFSGYIDNTDIPKIIGELMGIGRGHSVVISVIDCIDCH